MKKYLVLFIILGIVITILIILMIWRNIKMNKTIKNIKHLEF